MENKIIDIVLNSEFSVKLIGGDTIQVQISDGFQEAYADLSHERAEAMAEALLFLVKTEREETGKEHIPPPPPPKDRVIREGETPIAPKG